MSERIGAAMRRDVIARARHCCEYCAMPDVEALAPHEVDHVIAIQHGGRTILDNLTYACYQCNRFKGPNIASLHPAAGVLVPLFNPRAQAWNAHFSWNGPEIQPKTAIGRAPVALLRLNDPERITIRGNLLKQGRYPHNP